MWNISSSGKTTRLSNMHRHQTHEAFEHRDQNRSCDHQVQFQEAIEFWVRTVLGLQMADRGMPSRYVW